MKNGSYETRKEQIEKGFLPTLIADLKAAGCTINAKGRKLIAGELKSAAMVGAVSAFHEFLDNVQYFSEGKIVLCREHYSREVAAEMITREEIETYGTDENMTEERLREIILKGLKEGFVRYGFPPEDAGDGDNQAAWFVGASGKGSKAVWVYE